MKILITGVAGLLGSRLAQWIIENRPDCSVVGLDDLSGGYKENIPTEVDFYNVDLSNSHYMIHTVFKDHQPGVVYHFAAYAAEGLSPFIREFNYTNNLLATTKIVNECVNHNVGRLVFTSSMAVYGENKTPYHEEMIPDPIDPYGVAKAACEKDIQIAGEQHGLDWCIIRPHNVYGINQNIWDKYRNVLGIWMYQKLNGQPLTIFGDGEQKRAFSYIDDCLEPLWKAGTESNASKKIINLGGIKEYTILEACKTLQEIMGETEIKFCEARHEIKDAWSTFRKSQLVLGYEDNTSLKDGLTEMWLWAKKQPQRKQKVWSEYEIDRGIYEYWKIK